MKPSKKVEGKPYRYKAGSTPRWRFSMGTDLSFILVNHKDRAAIALSDRWTDEYFTRHMLGPTKAKQLVAWLCRYLNTVAPTDATKALEKTKFHARMVSKEQDNLMQQFLGED